MSHGPSMPPQEALKKLLDGNARYLSGNLTHQSRINAARRQQLTAGQAPFAALLSCADSRVPPEHIFDAGLGETFVCRNAGNLIDEATLGSLEYAVAHTGCPVICVMGHNKCGAVGAAVAVAKNPSLHETPNVDDVIRRLLPAVIATRRDGQSDAEWTDAAARQNVADTCKHILQRSPLLQAKMKAGDVMIIGAWYDLGSAKVEVLN